MKLTYIDDRQEIKAEVEVSSVLAIEPYLDGLEEDEYILLEASDWSSIQTWREQNVYRLEYQVGEDHFQTQPDLVGKADVQAAFRTFFVHGSESTEFQNLQVWQIWDEDTYIRSSYSMHWSLVSVPVPQTLGMVEGNSVASSAILSGAGLIHIKVQRPSESGPEATLVWLRNEGDTVARGEALINVITTDDVVFELGAPDAGLLAKILKDTGETVSPGDLVAQLDSHAQDVKIHTDNSVSGQTPCAAGTHNNGHEFEEFVASTLRNAGWTTRLTRKTGDQGLDLLALDKRFRVAIQCKRYSSPIGNAAIQEVHAAADFFGATHAAVVTTSSFTASAIQLAEALGVVLLSENELADLRSHLIFLTSRQPRKTLPSMFRDESST